MPKQLKLDFQDTKVEEQCSICPQQATHFCRNCGSLLCSACAVAHMKDFELSDVVVRSAIK